MKLVFRNAYLIYKRYSSISHIVRMASSKTPGCNLYWTASSDEISKRTDILMKSTTEMVDGIVKLGKDSINIDTVLKPCSLHDASYDVERNMLDFLQHVSTDKGLREASTAADKALSAFEVDLSMRKDLFDIFTMLEENTASVANMDAEDKRYIQRTIKNGKRRGLHLESDVRDKLKASLKRESELGIDFERNLGDNTSAIFVTKEQLAGIDDDFINGLEKNDEGLFKVTCKYPHYFPVMKKCSVPETRKALETAFNSRCRDTNSAILKELTALRAERASILGFDSHADFILDMRMAKNSVTVKKFLSELSSKLVPLRDQELTEFSELKKELGESDTSVRAWDLRFYMNLVEERRYAVDHVALKQYLPMNVVTKGLLDIYQELLSLKFQQIEDPDVWHEDVTMYSVKDSVDGTLLGYFYLDLYPRDGKYGHAACFGLQPGYFKDKDDNQVAVAAMVANFTKPLGDKPALLQHDEVETYFHEFGHVMHQICARPRHAFFAGTRVERDFVEAPSQMLENWCWQEESLRKMSAHHETGAPIPQEMLSKLVASRQANAGVFNSRQMLLASFDQAIHARGGDELDPETEYARLSKEMLSIPATDGTNMPATFGHLAGGYDAQYYGYSWSEVFSMDMFDTCFKKNGVMCAKTGGAYRRYILQPGGSRDASDMLRDFLGREPNQEAFLRSKGLQV